MNKMNLFASSTDFKAAFQLASNEVFTDRRLPSYIFRNNRVHAFIDSDSIYNVSFFKGLIKFLETISDEALFLQLLPDPEKYFFANFGQYPAFKISKDSDPNDCIDLLERDPGSSPADAIAYNSEIVLFISKKQEWCIYVDRSLELSVTSFINVESESLFFKCIPVLSKFDFFYVKELLEPVFCNAPDGVERVHSLIREFTQNYERFPSNGENPN